MSHSTNTVGEHLSQEDLIIKLHKAEKEREKGTESYGLQMFSFHTGGFSKTSQMVFNAQLYANTELSIYCTAAILRDASAVFSTIDSHPVGAPDHSSSANSFHNDWCFF